MLANIDSLIDEVVSWPTGGGQPQRDDSGSGHGIRFLMSAYGRGEGYDEASDAIARHHGRAGDWWRRTDDRQRERAWEEAVRRIDEKSTTNDNGKLPWNEDEPFLKAIGEIMEKDISWVWFPYLMRGEITIAEGDPGARKSFWAEAVAVHLVEGYELPSKYPELQTKPGKVILFDCENAGETVLKARLRCLKLRHGDRILIREVPFLLTDETIDKIIEIVKVEKPCLIVFDTINDYFDPRGNTDKSRDVVQALQPFKKLAKEVDCAVMLVRHLTKDHTKKAIYRGQGSISFSGKARVVIALGPDPEDDSISRFAITKISSVAKLPSHAFRVIDQSTVKEQIKFTFRWLGLVGDLTSDQILGTEGKTGSPGRPPVELTKATGFLQDRLANGKVEAARIFRMATEDGHSEITIKRAAKDMGITKRKIGKKWWWSIGSQ